MNRIPIQSSNLAEVGYDTDSMMLEVLFHNGTVYQFFDVPEALYLEMMQSDSKGKFFNTQIKNSFRFAKL